MPVLATISGMPRRELIVVALTLATPRGGGTLCSRGFQASARRTRNPVNLNNPVLWPKPPAWTRSGHACVVQCTQAGVAIALGLRLLASRVVCGFSYEQKTEGTNDQDVTSKRQ